MYTCITFNNSLFVVIDCGELTPPANGGVDVTSTLLGGMATYMCNNGYNINEDEIRTCGDNGNWSGNEPSCQSKKEGVARGRVGEIVNHINNH